MNRPLAVGGLERAVEHRQVLVLEERRALDRFLLVDVMDDRFDFGRRVSELLERQGHGLIDDLHQPAADELLVFHQRDVGLHAGRVAVHHEADGAGRREHRGLRVPVAEVLAELDGLVPRLLRAGKEIAGTYF